MYGLKNDNDGFSIFELLIVVIILAAISIVGFNIYKHVHSNDKQAAKSRLNPPAKQG
jgi:prepilin-type N-terminal cleavage/methylation domain-containing protein